MRRCIAAGVALALVLAALVLFRVVRASRLEKIPVFWVRLSPAEAVEVGWERDLQRYGGRGQVNLYRTYLALERGGKRMEFLVSAASDEALHVEMRATSDLRGVWLVGRFPEPCVLASLDLRSGLMLNRNGIPMDWHLRLSEQEAGEPSRVGLQRAYPEWATTTGGRVLAADPDVVAR